jgi:glutamate-1-semialdehyde aminotransferase
MRALRAARTVTQRKTLVIFTGSAHDTTHVGADIFESVHVLEFGTSSSLDFIRAHGDEVGAVLAEPVQMSDIELQPREFLTELRAITDKSAACLIFDEVTSGFRVHIRGAQGLYGIRADLTCTGKAIGGGFPIGIIAGERAYMDSLDGGGGENTAGTAMPHPLALAATHASLEHIKECGDALQRELDSNTAAMAAEINGFCRSVGAPLEIRYVSSIWQVGWREAHPLRVLLFDMLRSRGIHIVEDSPCFMTTAHTPEDIDAIKTAFRHSISEMQESGFLPHRPQPTMAVDATRPPVPTAKLGRDEHGRPAWFVPDLDRPGKYRKLSVV